MANSLTSIPRTISGADGYWVGSLMRGDDLQRITAEIDRLFLQRIAQAAPDRVALFAQQGIARYHEISHLVDHSEIWDRLSRRFDAEALEVFTGTAMFRALRDIYGNFTITDEEDLGAPLVRWRLVRPNAASDVGPVHADSWFWDINRWPIQEGRKLVKVWSMLHGTPAESGLMVLPGSHRTRFDFAAEIRDGSAKPTFDAQGLNMVTVPTGTGQSIVFHYNLLHGGAVTQGDTTRVSFEFTMAVEERYLDG